MTENSKPKKITYSRACELVGDFMNSWAFLESALNESIAELLGMDMLEGIIATSNMQARDKIHIFKTLINLRGAPKEWCTDAIKTANEIAAMSQRRNTPAHVSFGPSKRGGVEFLPVKAKGNLTFPSTIWSEKDFANYSAEMENLKKKIQKITARLIATHVLMKAHAALSTGQPPPPEIQRHLVHLLQGNPDYEIATPETTSETPPKRPEG